MSTDSEDILPQEGGPEGDHSVFHVFSLLFPEVVGGNLAAAPPNKRMRLHFNKIGYKIYGKEQSRRVPSHRAKPGNPGYGFRLARWRDTLRDEDDRVHCETLLRSIACSEDLIQRVKTVVQEYHDRWERVRRPSRPAGPGRPRRLDGEPDSCEGLSEEEKTRGDRLVDSRKRIPDQLSANRHAGAQDTGSWYFMREFGWNQSAEAPAEHKNKRAKAEPAKTQDGATWGPLLATLPAQSAASVLAAGILGAAAIKDGCRSGPSSAAPTSTSDSCGKSLDLGLTLPPLRLNSGLPVLPGLITDSRESSPLHRASAMSRSGSQLSLQDLSDRSSTKPASDFEYNDESALGVLASLVCSSTV